MRFLTILTLGTMMCLLAPTALADDPFVQIHHDRTFPQKYPSCLLQISPMILEIQVVNEKAFEDEKMLLAELADAQEEVEALRLVRRIEKLEYDRQVDVLKIQSRYARLDGRLDLEREIKGLIKEIRDQDLARADAVVW